MEELGGKPKPDTKEANKNREPGMRAGRLHGGDRVQEVAAAAAARGLTGPERAAVAAYATTAIPRCGTRTDPGGAGQTWKTGPTLEPELKLLRKTNRHVYIDWKRRNKGGGSSNKVHLSMA